MPPKKEKTPSVGHNSGEANEMMASGDRIKQFIAQIERLEEEKKALSEDIRDIYGEVKAAGFEPKIIRKIVSLKKVNLEKRREEKELLELYACAIQLDLGL